MDDEDSQGLAELLEQELAPNGGGEPTDEGGDNTNGAAPPSLEELSRWAATDVDPSDPHAQRAIHEAFRCVFLEGVDESEGESDDEGSEALVSDESEIAAPSEEDDEGVIDFDADTIDGDEGGAIGLSENEAEMAFLSYINERHALRTAHPPSMDRQSQPMPEHTVPEYLDIGPSASQVFFPTEVPLADGATVELSLEREALWILRQMHAPHRLLHRSATIANLFSLPPEEMIREAEVDAVVSALECIQRRRLDPAYLMIYRASEFAPLLNALWDDDTVDRMTASETSVQLAYCSVTGRRQRPIVRLAYVGNAITIGSDSIGVGDELWESISKDTPTVRRPCVLDVGRLLQDIHEWGILCHELERRRLTQLQFLRSLSPADHRRLSSLELDCIPDVARWEVYTDSLQRMQDVRDGRSTGTRASERVIAMGLEAALHEFALPAQSYHDNFSAGRNEAGSCEHMTIPLHEWLHSVFTAVAHQLLGGEDEVLALFTAAFAERYAVLPLVLAAALQLYCAHGVLIVVPKGRSEPIRSRSIASILLSDPLAYFDVLQEERSHLCTLHVTLDDHGRLRKMLRLQELFDPNIDDNDAWAEARRGAIDALLAALAAAVVGPLRDRLRRAAEAVAKRRAREALASLCAMGPYDRTILNLTPFTFEHDLWETWWNVVESLPDPQSPIRVGQARVCAVVHHDRDTHIAVIDEMGNFSAQMRWVSYPKTKDGENLQKLQRSTLVAHFARCCPHVIVVGATGKQACEVYQDMRKVVEGGVYPTLRVHIPVRWAAADPALAFATSPTAQRYLGHLPLNVIRAIGLARFVQDPLRLLATLLTDEDRVLQLPLGVHAMLRPAQAFRALREEMKLWVAAVGVDLPRVYAFGPDECRAILQFVPGMGPQSAEKFLSRVASEGRLPRCKSEVSAAMDDAPSAVCAAPCMRFPKRATEMPTAWHPMDATLAPPDYFGAAERLAAFLLGEERDDPQRSHAVRWFAQDPPTRRHRAAEVWTTAATDAVDRLYDDLKDSIPDARRREVEFLMDEMVLAGASAARRGYRVMSGEVVWNLLTCTRYLRRTDPRAATPPDGAIVEGDAIVATVTGVRGGARPGIRLATTRGIEAFASADDVEGVAHKEELLEYLYQLQQAKDEALATGTPRKAVAAPPWLTRGTTLVGVVGGINPTRCEMRIRLPSDPTNFDALLWRAPTVTPAQDGAAMSIARSGTSTLRSEQLTAAGAVTAMNVSTHPLFRNVGRERMAALLDGASVGETLLRPSSDPRTRRHAVVACIKVGQTAVGQWPLVEDRRADGRVRYVLRDRRSNKEHEFGSIDHFIATFAKRLAGNVEALRLHRRFSITSMVNETIEAQLKARGGETDGEGRRRTRLTYAIAEDSTVGSTTFYTVHCQVGQRRWKILLHVDNEGYYVYLRKLHSPVHIWTFCATTDDVTSTVKEYFRLKRTRVEM